MTDKTFMFELKVSGAINASDAAAAILIYQRAAKAFEDALEQEFCSCEFHTSSFDATKGVAPDLLTQHKAERVNMSAAHAEGWHAEFPREFCPDCEGS